MGAPDPSDPPSGANLKKTSAAVKQAWARTLEEMEQLAEERRDDGWEVTTVRSSHTDPVSKEMGEHDRFGLFHVVPKSDGEAFVDAYDEDAFTDFFVYGSDIEGRRFGVTELIDPNEQRSIIIAYEFPYERLTGLPENAQEEGVVYTYVRKIDGTILGRFEHDPYEPVLGMESAD